MEALSSSSLAEALRICDKHEGAKIGVVCADSISAKAMIESFWDEISHGRMPGWEMGKEVSGCSATLRKKVKAEYSTIEIFVMLSSWRAFGKSYHQVLYDKRLDFTLITNLAICERLSFDPSEDGGTELLDEFLNSFKIV